jgi:hypothetical protein
MDFYKKGGNGEKSPGHCLGTNEEGWYVYACPEGWAPIGLYSLDEDGNAIDAYPDLNEKIVKRAKEDAEEFVDEFGEALDGATTDWDATAWGFAEADILGDEVPKEDREGGWTLYSDVLEAETRRLVNERAA